MKIPNYMRKPLNTVGHPNSTVRALRSALAIDRALQRQAGAPRETIRAFDYMVQALRKVESGTALVDAFDLNQESCGVAIRSRGAP